MSYNSAWYTFSGLLSKNTVTTKEYTPFGELLTEDVSGFGYRGEYYNAQTGAVYLRARYYEPELGRFNQKDILRGDISVPVSLNRYAYVRNDPVNFVDPSGMSLKSLVQKGVSKVTNAVKSFVQDPIGTTKKAANTVVKAVSDPVGTAKKIVNSAKNAINELFSPNTIFSSTRNSASNQFTTNGNSSSLSGGQLSSNRANGVSRVAVSSPTKESKACKNSLWDTIAQAEIQRAYQQQLEAAARADMFLGAINSSGRNAIDVLAGIARFFAPNKSYNINSNTERWKEWLETSTKDLASNDISYDVGQLAGDTATTAIEYFTFAKAIKGLYGVFKKAPVIFDALSRMGGTLASANGALLESAIPATGAVAGTEALAGAWALLGDIFLNASTFKNDWDTLNEDIERDKGTQENSQQEISSQLTRDSLPETKYTTSKLQHEFRHANDFGIEGSWNKQNGIAFQEAIQNHIDTSPEVYLSTYKWEQVYVYYNPETGLGAYVDLQGNFICGWKLSESQIYFHLTNGILIG